MFTPTVFEILMSEGRSVLSPAQRGTRSKRVNCLYVFCFLYTRNAVCVFFGDFSDSLILRTFLEKRLLNV